MSFLKAEKLLALASLTASRHSGISLEDVQDRFGVSKRTAQRMLKALESQFPDTEPIFSDDGRKRWRLHRAAMKDIVTITPEELVAFDLAAQLLSGSASTIESDRLRSLREKICAMIPRTQAIRLEVDHEALLESHGFVAHPGPRLQQNPQIETKLADALKASCLLEIHYNRDNTEGDDARRVAPYGIVSGLRRYLLASQSISGREQLKLFRIERIRRVRLLPESFVRDPTFDLRAFSERSFGVFQSDDEQQQVILRFSRHAAIEARAFRFHPSQITNETDDGELEVRFRASGLLEMTWHLYMWGDHVEVVAPEVLRDMVHPYRRSDFNSLP